MLAEKTTPTSENMSPTSSPVRLLHVLRRHLWVIMLVTVVAVGAAVGFSLMQTPRYESSIRILISETGRNRPESVAGDVQGLQQLTATMAEAVQSIPVAEEVLKRVDLPGGTPEGLRGDMTERQQPGTMFITVSYRDTDPERAQLIANTIGEVFSEQVSKIAPSTVAPSTNTITATVWEPARLPTDPVSPNLVRNGALALVIGIFLGVMLALLLDYRADKWDSREEVEQVSGVPTFGLIPKFE